MTEIVMPIVSERFRKAKPAKRREILDGLAEALFPLNKGAIGQMIDKNNLEAALKVIERVNQKAYTAWHDAKQAWKAEHGTDYPIPFRSPFWWDPQNPSKQEAKWASQLKHAFGAHF